jgi:hypothetical protein
MDEQMATLLVLAAGWGQRFGGLKQLAQVGPSGEYLLDYAMYDAARAGFRRVVFPSFDVASQRVARLASGVQALAREDPDLDFSHVQPTGMLWRVVEANPTQQLGGLLLTQRIDEAFLEVGVEIVQDQVHASGRFIGRVEQVLDEGDEIGLAASPRDDDSSAARLGLNGDKQAGCNAARVFVVFLAHTAWLHRYRRAAVGNSCKLFSSMHTTGSSCRNGRAYSASKWYMRWRYSVVNAAIHHITFRQGLRRFF